MSFPNEKSGPDANPFATPETLESAAAPRRFISTSILADRGRRLLGAILDNLLLVAALLPGLIVVWKEDDFTVGGISVIGLPIAVLLVAQWYLISTTGQSLAKRWLGMRIVKVDGAPVGFVSGVLLRNWVIAVLGAIPGIGNIVGLVDVLMIFGEEHACLHDRIAGTKVIDTSFEAFEAFDEP